jgi:hypothetical protein
MITTAPKATGASKSTAKVMESFLFTVQPPECCVRCISTCFWVFGGWTCFSGRPPRAAQQAAFKWETRFSWFIVVVSPFYSPLTPAAD